MNLSTRLETKISIYVDRPVIECYDADNCYIKEVYLVAVLTDVKGKPLYGKKIIWQANMGEFEVYGDGLTDVTEVVRAIYRPPKVDIRTTLKITAIFEGDEEYNGCSATREIKGPRMIPMGPPPPPPPTTKLPPIGVLKCGEERTAGPWHVTDFTPLILIYYF